MIMKGRVIVKGNVEGDVVKFKHPIVVLGDVDEKKGNILGKSVKDKIVVFPRGVGSTVGSYTIYGLKFYGNAPKAFILEEAETIVAAGVIMADIPTVDRIDISHIHEGTKIILRENTVKIL